jgi:Ca-activated chloride channel homolog
MDGCNRRAAMNRNPSEQLRRWSRVFLIAAAFIVALGLAVGGWRNQHFWLTADQRGDLLSHQGKFAYAAHSYADPARIAAAQFRDGQFATAAKTYIRVPGAEGAFNMGDALVMSGKYDAAIAAYDRALGFRPGWKEAEENRALATARFAMLQPDEKLRQQEEANAYNPDKIVYDLKGPVKKNDPEEIAGNTPMNNEALQATWLRSV